MAPIWAVGRVSTTTALIGAAPEQSSYWSCDPLTSGMLSSSG
ncbi:hypothetical protein [uncultured Propionibacterium sp.]|nr:hypothetical protein [uncultured Propionibacterium sp.]